MAACSNATLNQQGVFNISESVAGRVQAPIVMKNQWLASLNLMGFNQASGEGVDAVFEDLMSSDLSQRLSPTLRARERSGRAVEYECWRPLCAVFPIRESRPVVESCQKGAMASFDTAGSDPFDPNARDFLVSFSNFWLAAIVSPLRSQGFQLASSRGV